MKSFVSRIMFAAGCFTAVSGLFADCPHTEKMTNNYTAPVGRFILNPVSEDGAFAFSFLGEAGVRNFRLNGTGGTWTTERSRLKVSGEYLVQKLSYNYFSGKKAQWVQQGAVGADWEYLLDCDMLKAVDVQGYYSYAPSKSLRPYECTDGTTFIRRLAGSNAYGGSLGGLIMLCDTSKLDVELDYDYVKYNRKIESAKTVKGFGGGFTWTTRVLANLDFSLTAQFRQPFNFIGGKLNWLRAFNSPRTTFGLYTGWTQGKSHLPNNFTAGVELAYSFALGNCCNEVADCGCPALYDPCSLGAWVLTPAVYMPEVLVIRDRCADIALSSPIPGLVISVFGVPDYALNIPELGNFTSATPLTYTATGLPPGTQIDPVTGIITGDFSADVFFPYLVTVTGTGTCDSTSQTFTITYIPTA